MHRWTIIKDCQHCSLVRFLNLAVFSLLARALFEAARLRLLQARHTLVLICSTCNGARKGIYAPVLCCRFVYSAWNVQLCIVLRHFLLLANESTMNGCREGSNVAHVVVRTVLAVCPIAFQVGWCYDAARDLLGYTWTVAITRWRRLVLFSRNWRAPRLSGRRVRGESGNLRGTCGTR